MTEIQSKHGIVGRAPYEIYMLFVDMRNFVQYLPEEQKQNVTADYDSLKADVQGSESAYLPGNHTRGFPMSMTAPRSLSM